jgi:hypothetical protein
VVAVVALTLAEPPALQVSVEVLAPLVQVTHLVLVQQTQALAAVVLVT